MCLAPGSKPADKILPNRAGEPHGFVGFDALRVDSRDQRIDRHPLRFRLIAQQIPEHRLQRDAGLVTGNLDRSLDGWMVVHALAVAYSSRGCNPLAPADTYGAAACG